MNTTRATPTPEFCEAADLVLGGHTPAHILPVMMEGGELWMQVRAVHAEIMRRNETKN